MCRKLQEELDAVNPNPQCLFDPSHVDRVKYLEQVINEGLRLWPVVAMGSAREAPIDYEYGGYVLPKGSSIAMHFYTLFRTGISVLNYTKTALLNMKTIPL